MRPSVAAATAVGALEAAARKGGAGAVAALRAHLSPAVAQLSVREERRRRRDVWERIELGVKASPPSNRTSSPTRPPAASSRPPTAAASWTWRLASGSCRRGTATPRLRRPCRARRGSRSTRSKTCLRGRCPWRRSSTGCCPRCRRRRCGRGAGSSLPTRGRRPSTTRSRSRARTRGAHTSCRLRLAVGVRRWRRARRWEMEHGNGLDDFPPPQHSFHGRTLGAMALTNSKTGAWAVAVRAAGEGRARARARVDPPP